MDAPALTPPAEPTNAPSDGTLLHTLYAHSDARFRHLEDQHTKVFVFLATAFLGGLSGVILGHVAVIPAWVVVWFLPLLGHLHIYESDILVRQMHVFRDLMRLELRIPIGTDLRHYCGLGTVVLPLRAWVISSTLVALAVFGAAAIAIKAYNSWPASLSKPDRAFGVFNYACPFATFALMEFFGLSYFFRQRDALYAYIDSPTP